jgi:hypothetical protein
LKNDAHTDWIVGCRHLVELVRSHVRSADGQESSEGLSRLAGEALERFAGDLLAILLAAASCRTEPEEPWIRRQFSEGLESAGAALREALAGSRYRHAVAQELQRRMFEAEVMLRRTLKARTLEGGAASVGAAS